MKIEWHRQTSISLATKETQKIELIVYDSESLTTRNGVMR